MPNQIHLSSSSPRADKGVGKRTVLPLETEIPLRELTTLGGGAAVRWRALPRAGISRSKMGKAVRKIQNWASLHLLRVGGIEILEVCRSQLTKGASSFDIPKFILSVLFQKRSYLFIQSDRLRVWTIFAFDRCCFVTSLKPISAGSREISGLNSQPLKRLA
jgi:hypothetical protein